MVVFRHENWEGAMGFCPLKILKNIFLLSCVRFCSSYSYINFVHSFLFRTFLLVSFHVTFLYFKMSAVEFSHVFLGRSLFLFPVILVCHTFFTGLLLFILIKWPNHLSCCLCIFFNIGPTFNSCLNASFLTLFFSRSPFYSSWILNFCRLDSTSDAFR